MAKNKFIRNKINTRPKTIGQTITIRKGSEIAKKTTMIDARQRIIQKKRKTVVDARDVLARLAKTHDARDKIVKLRGGKPNNGNVQAIGTHILRKTDRNGKISLVTNKNKKQINTKIQEQLGLVSRQQSTKNVKKPMIKRAPKPEISPQIIRKTIRNEYTSPMVHVYGYDHPDMYRWYPGISPLLAPPDLRRPVPDMTISRGIVNDQASGEWSTFSSKLRQNGYLDLDAVHDEEMPMVHPARPPVRTNIHSRLDSQPAAASSHGIFGHGKPKIAAPTGHRIVVSNLQTTVTQDDIRELFEDIGQLMVAKLVKPGVAEVIYKNLKDAQHAVESYHNRQLDGQPMKCMLVVNKKPNNASPMSEGILSRKPSSSITPNNSNKLVPDISTIHKVLFQRN